LLEYSNNSEHVPPVVPPVVLPGLWLLPVAPGSRSTGRDRDDPHITL